MPFSEKMKEIRKKKNISQVSLSVRSGISQSAISSIERGEQSPTEESMIKIASALHVPLSAMLEDSEIKEKPAEIGGLDEKFLNLIRSLHPEEIQRVCDFVSGLLSSR